MSHQELFVSAFVYLATAAIAVPIAKRLGLSSVLGYLVAGMAIGPFGLHLVGEEGQDVMHFAEFGVVMMLFLVGLELQPSMLWRMRGPILGLGGTQVVATTGLIALIAISVGLQWQMALAIGMALSLSSTAIVLQSLQEKGLSGSSGGKSAFSVLLFQDIAVIPMLATFPLLATLSISGGDDGHGHGHSAFQDWLAHQPAWINTVLVLGAVIGIILAGKYIVQPLLRLVAKTRVREAFVALALMLVVGIALLMSSLGVSAALGTFLAGVVLADSEYRHELESDIEPFKGLLLGVFFIAVGASVDFNLALEQPVVIGAIVLGIIVLKGAILLGLGAVWKLGVDQRILFSTSLAQGSEFAFVLLGFGIAEGVMSLQVGQILVASVALSMACAPLVMLFEERFLRKRFGTKEKAARAPDEIDESAPVILVGIGRFGNFIARMLRAQKVKVTVIDNDSDHINYLRKIGIEAYYGDASRYDLLETAGAAKAKMIIIAVDDEDQIHALVETCRKHFPSLKILTRALSKEHEYRLINDGVDCAVHQHAGSAIQLAQSALVELGYRSYFAHRKALAFYQHDRKATKRIAEVRHDEKAFMDRVREHLDEIQQQFAQDDLDYDDQADLAWDTRRLREDTSSDDYSDVVPASKD